VSERGQERGSAPTAQPGFVGVVKTTRMIRNEGHERIFSIAPGLLRPGLLVLSLLSLVLSGVLLSSCGALGGGAALSDVRASTDTIVPGSSGVGNPPGAVEIRYVLGSAADVTAGLQGQTSGTLLPLQRQEPGEHVLRFAGVITADQSLGGPDGGYRLVRRAVPDGDYTVVISAGGITRSVPLKVSKSNVQPHTLTN